MDNILLGNLIRFSGVLRSLGLQISTAQNITLASALKYIDPTRKLDFYNTLRCILVNNPNDYPVFAKAFSEFWISQKMKWKALEFSSSSKKSTQLTLEIETGDLSLDRSPNQPETPIPSHSFSIVESLSSKDFADMSEEEKSEIYKAIKKMKWDIGRIKSRRYKRSRGFIPDIRSTLSESLRNMSEIMEWKYFKPSTKPRSIVILADVSGSMEVYSNILLRLMHAFSHGLQSPVESFVFSTSISRITRQIRNKHVDQSIKSAAQIFSGWSGGTHIGKALKEFNSFWLRRSLRPSSILLVISDGWDRGNPELIRKEISRLQLNCHRLIWLNPHLGSPDYKPLTRGMAAALPYIDDFLPVHNLNSLDTLIKVISNIPPKQSRKTRMISFIRKQQYA